MGESESDMIEEAGFFRRLGDRIVRATGTKASREGG
jgi:hypothetical protein